ncbi:MAG: hypothetical protein LUE17_05735 [Planctomycetaceae bacterium]|nr:hypothetical protein [Planctomycetaceae bacterium]
MTDYSDLSPTFRLFAIPTLLEGMTMALDYAHTMPEYNGSVDGKTADSLSLAADLRAVAADFRSAMASYQDNPV